MHAYLLIGNSAEYIDSGIEALAKKLKIKTLEFSLAKIEDVRALNSFISLTIAEPTAIVLKKVDGATTEALNAFLKNLEEPQENLYFILTASLSQNVLPTILSRCQIIKIGYREESTKNSDADTFMKMDVGERLAFTETVRKRDEALAFVENFILACHRNLTRGIKLAKHIIR